MGSPVIFQGNYAKFLKSYLNLNGSAYILTGSDDPTSVAKDGPKGSIYMRQTGSGDGLLYVKKDNGSSTNWKLIQNLDTIGISLDNGVDVITTGPKGFITIPYDCVILNWSITADVVGSITFDIWKVNGSIPNIGNTITAAAKPTLSSAQLANSSTLTGWTTSVSARDVFCYNVDSVSTVKRVNLVLEVLK